MQGIPNFSRLPKVSKLIFPSAAVLIVEEEGPPYLNIGLEIEKIYIGNSGKDLIGKMFPKHVLHLHDVVGFADIGGLIKSGDEITV